MIKWYIDATPHVGTLLDYFKFNSVDFSDIAIWDSTISANDIPSSLIESSNTGLIIDVNTFKQLVTSQSQHLIEYINQNNYTWVWNKQDSFVSIVDSADVIDNLKIIDNLVIPNRLTIFLDATPVSEHLLANLKNISVKIFPNNYFYFMPRIQNALLDKNNDARDFLLTTINKGTVRTYHRQLLWQELNSRNKLLEKGTVSFTQENQKYDKWVGQKNNTHSWHDGHPSMDLYLNNWLEVIPETLYDHGFFVTEKTIKPIATKTPFLILSTPGYLKYLRNNGFKTFSHLIDESYDTEVDLSTRIKLLVNSLEDIVSIGGEKFYRSCQDILDHNYFRLAEIVGMQEHSIDLLIKQCLDEVDKLSK